MSKLSSGQAAWVMRLAKALPFYKHLGITLTDISWGHAQMQLKVKRELTQSAGSAHGGVMASMIDSVVGIALYTMLTSEDHITTIELKVNFIAPAKPGMLKAHGRIISKGKRIAVGDADVRDDRGTLIAKGLVTYMIMANQGQRFRSIKLAT